MKSLFIIYLILATDLVLANSEFDKNLGDFLFGNPPTAAIEKNWNSASFCRSDSRGAEFNEFYYFSESKNLFAERGDLVFSFSKNSSGKYTLMGMEEQEIKDLSISQKPALNMLLTLVDPLKNGLFIMWYGMSGSPSWPAVKSTFEDDGTIQTLNQKTLENIWDDIPTADLQEVRDMAKITFKIISVDEKIINIQQTSISPTSIAKKINCRIQ